MHFATCLADGSTVDAAMKWLCYTLAYAAIVYLPVQLAFMVTDRRQSTRPPRTTPERSKDTIRVYPLGRPTRRRRSHV